MVQLVKLTGIISKKQIDQRLDQTLAKMFPDYSRSCIKRWILNQYVLVNGKIWNKPKEKVLGGELVNINAKIKDEISLEAQDIPLNIIYEDHDILIINKPHNLVVHPGAGNPNGTMLNALLGYYPPIASVPRAGVIHRLDKDTTGLMVVAKTIPAQTQLIKLLQSREITREYEAVVIGHTAANGMINKPIGRHPTKRTHMSVQLIGKHAITHYRSIEYFRIHTHLLLRLETGRTHQIRVHMAHITHPLVGDPVYGYRRLPPPQMASKALITMLHKFNRQALHASILSFSHPITGIRMKWHAPMPQDMINLLEVMRTDLEKH